MNWACAAIVIACLIAMHRAPDDRWAVLACICIGATMGAII
jgi:hypothetical protein